MKLEWVTNDDRGLSLEWGVSSAANEKKAYWQWRKQFKEGPPMATAKHTVGELKKMGLVGLYREEE